MVLVVVARCATLPRACSSRYLAPAYSAHLRLGACSLRGKSTLDDRLDTLKAPNELAERVQLVRNIGIIAHIDAGKTTTTERILYLTGKTKHQGSVDSGDTVTDFMPQERERGITIQSASVTVDWESVRLNVIDTPGHIDFGIEVERCVRVLDGTVLILDGVAGVQAQTETVWRTADKHVIPSLAFVNKMDREGASLNSVLASLEKRLGVTPLPLQVPVGRSDSFRGVIDLITMQAILYQAGTDKRAPVRAASRDTVSFVAAPIEQAEEIDPGVIDRAHAARKSLVWALSDIDEEFFEVVLEGEEEEQNAEPDHLAGASTGAGVGAEAGEGIKTHDFLSAIRRACLARSGVPVLLGASLRGIGVEPLLDGVVAFLPSPLERLPPTATMHSLASVGGKKGVGKRHRRKVPRKGVGDGNEVTGTVTVDPLGDRLVALVFKVTYDKQRGPLSFFRVYSGTLQAKAPVFNSTKGIEERPLQILRVEAGDLRAIDSVSTGDVAVAVGLSHTSTGDTLVDGGRGVALPGLRLDGVSIPQPVFSLAVEPETTSQQGALEDALAQMMKEDPSLVVEVDGESGQTVLKGIGELHLEVVCERVRREFGVEVQTGQVYVAYREGILERAEMSQDYDRVLAGKHLCAGISVVVTPEGDLGAPAEIELSEGVEASIEGEQIEALIGGLRDALSRGPVGGYPLAGLTLEVTELRAGEHSSPGAIRFAAASIVVEVVKAGGVGLLEPVMDTEVSISEAHLGAVLHDLSASRRAEVMSVEAPFNGSPGAGATGGGGGRHTVRARVPLRELLGYATALRSISAGEGSFTMEFGGYTRMDADVQKAYP
ncbi:unnamed protein product [Discosporangium mesarthrocarpum]